MGSLVVVIGRGLGKGRSYSQLLMENGTETVRESGNPLKGAFVFLQHDILKRTMVLTKAWLKNVHLLKGAVVFLQPARVSEKKVAKQGGEQLRKP